MKKKSSARTGPVILYDFQDDLGVQQARYFKGGGVVAETASVDPKATVDDKSTVAGNCLIESKCEIIESTIQHQVVVKEKSIITKCNIGVGSWVGDAIILKKINLPPHSYVSRVAPVEMKSQPIYKKIRVFDLPSGSGFNPRKLLSFRRGNLYFRLLSYPDETLLSEDELFFLLLANPLGLSDSQLSGK